MSGATKVQAQAQTVLTDDHKAFLLSLALACIADVRQSERRTSKRERLMMQCEDYICQRTEIYCPNAWSPEMMAKAGNLIDRINEMVAKEFA